MKPDPLFRPRTIRDASSYQAATRAARGAAPTLALFQTAPYSLFPIIYSLSPRLPRDIAAPAPRAPMGREAGGGQVLRLGAADQPERRVAGGLGGQEIQEIPLRHEGQEAVAGRQPAEIGDPVAAPADDAREVLHAALGEGAEALGEAQLVHQVEGGGVDRVAAEVAEEIRVLLQHGDVDARAGEEQSGHHPGRQVERHRESRLQVGLIEAGEGEPRPGRHEQRVDEPRLAVDGERAGDEQQRITGQEGRDDEPGFTEDDGEEDRVNPNAVVIDQPLQVLVEMQNSVLIATVGQTS